MFPQESGVDTSVNIDSAPTQKQMSAKQFKQDNKIKNLLAGIKQISAKNIKQTSKVQRPGSDMSGNGSNNFKTIGEENSAANIQKQIKQIIAMQNDQKQLKSKSAPKNKVIAQPGGSASIVRKENIKLIMNGAQKSKLQSSQKMVLAADTI